MIPQFVAINLNKYSKSTVDRSSWNDCTEVERRTVYVVVPSGDSHYQPNAHVFVWMWVCVRLCVCVYRVFCYTDVLRFYIIDPIICSVYSYVVCVLIQWFCVRIHTKFNICYCSMRLFIRSFQFYFLSFSWFMYIFSVIKTVQFGRVIVEQVVLFTQVSL